jgi:acyl-CoA synthetase (AMP-forming)/AMP-acid ligase II
MLYEHLSNRALKRPGKVAVIQGQRKVTYEELNLGVSRFALFLSGERMQPGDRAAILIDNSPEYIISYFGVHKAGGISVAVNTQNSAYELKKIFDDCLPSVLVISKRHLKLSIDAFTEGTSVKTVIVADAQDNDELTLIIKKHDKGLSHFSVMALQNVLKTSENGSALPMINKHDIASIIYTSGTTGVPKGVMLTHNNFEANANSIVEYLHLTEDDRNMVVLPFNYSYGTSVLTTSIISGGSMVLENSFMYPNVILDKMVQEDVTGFAGVPSTFALLLNRSNIRKYSFPKLRYVTQAGGAMSPTHSRELAEILSGTDIYIMYGQTEAAPRLTYLEPMDFLKKPDSIGKAIPGISIDIINENGELAGDGEEGEIVAQGENIMSGYWNNPEETKKVLRNGRLYTGDLAVRDSEGYLKIISRRSDMIKSGAHKISPKEIEEVILEMIEVHEVAVVGGEDDILGVIIKAFVVMKENCSLDVKNVQKYCRNKLATFKIPKEVVFVEKLPKTSSGKVRKHLLEKTEKLN